MKLSREMEYHADLIAVSVSGNQSFKDALRKIEFSSFAYDYTTEYLNSLARQERASPDIYLNHSFTTTFLARLNKIFMKGDTPDFSEGDIEKNVVKTRLNIKDQWASHPSLKEREENIDKVNILAEVNENAAWTVFTNPEKLREDTTKNLYKHAFPDLDFKSLTEQEFQEFVNTEINKYKIAEDYNGFYEGRYVSTFTLEEITRTEYSGGFEDLYAVEVIEKIKRLASDKADLDVLGQINRKQLKTKYFEFDGKKYKRKEAGKLILSLEKEIQTEERTIEQIDKHAFSYHYQKAKGQDKGEALLKYYEEYFHAAADMREMDGFNTKLQNLGNTLYAKSRWTEEEIQQLASELSVLERQFKYFLLNQDLNEISQQVDNDQRKVLKEYVTSHTFYIGTRDFDEQSLMNLSNVIQYVSGSIGTRYGNALKGMTDFQLGINGEPEGA